MCFNFSIKSTMNSYTFTLNGKSSELSATFFPAIELDERCDYVCGLSDFHAYNSIPNVDESNNSFCFFEERHLTLQNTGFYTYDGWYKIAIDADEDLRNLLRKPDDTINVEKYDLLLKENDLEFKYDEDYKHDIVQLDEVKLFKYEIKKIIKIPIGSYEINEIFEYLKQILKNVNDVIFDASVDKNTLKSVIKCNRKIDFTISNSIGTLFGFTKKVLYEKNKIFESENIVNIFKVNAIRIECDLVKGSYINNKAVYTIHEFFPTVSTGYKIVEIPNNIIYLPVAARTIHSINVRILDQEDNLVNFRGEKLTVRLHIKKWF